MCWGEAEGMPASSSVTPYLSFPALSELEAQQFSYNGWPMSLKGPVSSLSSAHRSQLGVVTKAWWPALHHLSHLPSLDLWTSEHCLASGSVQPVSNSAKAVIIFQELAAAPDPMVSWLATQEYGRCFHVQSRGLLVIAQALRMPALNLSRVAMSVWKLKWPSWHYTWCHLPRNFLKASRSWCWNSTVKFRVSDHIQNEFRFKTSF